MRKLFAFAIRTVAVVAAVLVVVPDAHAATVSGPAVHLDQSEVKVGERIDLRISGFASPFVTISTCGNEARRGSVDCNLIASQGLRLDADGGSGASIVIAEPPAKCPCVVRVANQTNDEIATTPIDIADHPKGDVVDPPLPTDAVRVALTVRPAASGVIDGVRSSMGGAARYAITLRVTNRTSVPLRKVALFGSVGRGSTDEVAAMDIPSPDEILPGQTWEQQVFTRVPSPTFGSFTFRVSATGAGPTVDATATLRHGTPMLFALLAVLTLEITYVIYRWLTRRRMRRTSALGDAVGDDDLAPEHGVANLSA